MQVVQNRFLSNYLRNLVTTMEHDVQSAADNYFSKENQSSFINAVIEKYSLAPIQLHIDQQEITTYPKAFYPNKLTDMRSAFIPITHTAVVCHIPVSGNAALLEFDPMQSNRCSLPSLTITNNEICFEVILNDHQPEESNQLIQSYTLWIQQQVTFINTDLVSYNTQLKNQVQRIVEQKSKSINHTLDALAAIKIPLRKKEALIALLATPSIAVCNDTYYTLGISYGGLDEVIATKINDHLISHGVKTWFFPKNALPGEKLHRMMFKMANEYDRVLLLCSQSSLNRNGVLNEIEEVFAKEARKGSHQILIPIAIDDYVFNEWAPEQADIATRIRDRVIGKLNSAEFESEETQNQLKNILLALKKK